MRLGAYRLLGGIPLVFNYLKVNKNIKISGLSGVCPKLISSVCVTPLLVPTPVLWSSHFNSNVVGND